MHSSDDSSLWYVAFSSDDVRVWSLDQLNDAFRFDVVGAGTLVQQHGSREWQRLGVMAGIEPEGTPVDCAPPSSQAVARALRDAGLAGQPSVPAPAATSYAPPPFAPTPHAAAPFGSADRAPRRRRSSGAGWLFAAAALGALPVLYRNDLLLAAAQRAGRQAQYLSLEKAYLGGPSYGTPRQLAGQFLSLEASTSAALPAPTAAEPVAAPVPASPSPASTGTARAAAPAPPAPAAPGAVSLDALPVEAAQAQRATGPSRPASVARAASPAPQAAPAVQLDEKPAKHAPAPKADEPVPADPLKAAIFTAIKNDSKKK